jgi:hypothetical protein
VALGRYDAQGGVAAEAVRWMTGRRMRLKRGNEYKESGLTKIVVVEQWICFLLGVVCIAFGLWGICMDCSQEALRPYVAWLGSAYEPTLRRTAILCFGLGIALVYRAWTQP